jgi:hypothetical protein
MRKMYWLKAASRFSINFCRLTFWVIVFIMIHRHAVEGIDTLSVVIYSCLNNVSNDFPIICVLMTNRLIWITNLKVEELYPNLLNIMRRTLLIVE